MTHDAPNAKRVPSPSTASRAVLVVALAMIVVGFNTTAISTATRGIADDLGASVTMLGWIVASYLLAAAALSVVGGRLGDSVGRARTFLAGTIVFLGGSLVAAAAPGEWVLIIGRAIQGVGAALIVPASIELIAGFSSTTGTRSGFRTRNLAYVFSFAIGPLLGGLLTDELSWRGVFWFDATILVVVAVLTRPLLAAATRLPHRPARDMWGATLLALLSFLVVLAAFEMRGWGFSSPVSILVLVTIGVLALALVETERRARHPLVHRSVLADRMLIGANVATLAASVGMLGMLYFFNLYAQSAATFDSTAVAAAVALIPFTLTLVLVASVARRLTGRFDQRVPVMSGLVVSVIGFWLLSRVTPATTEVQLFLPLSLCGLGAGVANAGLTGPAVLDVPSSRLDEAAGLSSLSRFIGSALAVALGTSSYLAVALGPLPLELAASGVDQEHMIVGGSTFQRAAAALDASLRAPFEAAAKAESISGFTSTMRLTAVLVALLTLLSGWLLRPRRTSC